MLSYWIKVIYYFKQFIFVYVSKNLLPNYKDNFGQVTCFDNFSNQRYRVVNLIDNQRYVCSKNSKIQSALDNWRKYTTYGTGHSVNANGDAYMAIALTY